MFGRCEENVNNWLTNTGWKENPFTLKIFPSLFIGYNSEREKLYYHIRGGHKFCLISGATGSGKTTLLKSIENQFEDSRKVCYLSKPPSIDEMTNLFLNIFKPSIFQRIFGLNVRIQDLPDYINKKLDNNKFLFLMDEAHEADLSTLEWLRTITDQVENMQLVIAGLPSLDHKLKENLETLLERITTRVELTTLTQDETKELIKKRIEYAGGNSIEPFTEEVIREIYQETGGFPREVLKLCDKLVTEAIKNRKNVIDDLKTIKREEKEMPRRGKTKEDVMKELSYKQRKIIKILSKEENLFPSEIAERFGLEKYKTRQHAIRSVNNIMRRLMKEDCVTRERKGKGYVYFLKPRIRNLLVES